MNPIGSPTGCLSRSWDNPVEFLQQETLPRLLSSQILEHRAEPSPSPLFLLCLPRSVACPQPSLLEAPPGRLTSVRGTGKRPFPPLHPPAESASHWPQAPAFPYGGQGPWGRREGQASTVLVQLGSNQRSGYFLGCSGSAGPASPPTRPQAGWGWGRDSMFHK